MGDCEESKTPRRCRIQLNSYQVRTYSVSVFHCHENYLVYSAGTQSHGLCKKPQASGNWPIDNRWPDWWSAAAVLGKSVRNRARRSTFSWLSLGPLQIIAFILQIEVSLSLSPSLPSSILTHLSLDRLFQSPWSEWVLYSCST